MIWLKWNWGTITILAAIIGAAFWMDCRFTDIEKRIDNLEFTIDEIETLMTFRG